MKRREFLNRSAILGATLVVPTTQVFNSCGLIVGDRSRNVLQVIDPNKTMVGSLPIIRAFPGGAKDYISPFVLFDEFGEVSVNAGAKPLGVEAHPHAGVVPTSYFISGSGHHKDNLDYDLQINQGEFMMFNSGRGAIHMEETGQHLYQNGGMYHGFQIWLNLPAKHKYVNPNTFIHSEKDLPIVSTSAYSVKVILGEYEGKRSSAETLTPAFYYDVKMNGNSKLNFDVEQSHNAFIYVINGSLELKGQVQLKKNQLALFERNKSEIEVFSPSSSEYLLLGGQPLDDPIVSYGPFVMNTEEQIQQCIKDYQAGKMGNPALIK